MLLYIGDDMCHIYTSKEKRILGSSLYVLNSEWVVDRIKFASLNASLGGPGD